ncbi:hypothetical protein VE03_10686 [Pseudogymnoascus sp. 23342-1-I1]|nr:hypothetical protein VE03_10686 [Pseudogymnoascus sp. 23342-1-I1]
MDASEPSTNGVSVSNLFRLGDATAVANVRVLDEAAANEVDAPVLVDWLLLMVVDEDFLLEIADLISMYAGSKRTKAPQPR